MNKVGYESRVITQFNEQIDPILKGSSNLMREKGSIFMQLIGATAVAKC